jgi:hypothetical protein
LYVVFLCDLSAQAFRGGGQAQIFQFGRMELMRKRLHILDNLSEALSGMRQWVLNFRLARKRMTPSIQLDREQSKLLGNVVVKLSRDSRSFFFLYRNQLSSHVCNSLLRPPTVGDVPHDACGSVNAIRAFDRKVGRQQIQLVSLRMSNFHFKPNDLASETLLQFRLDYSLEEIATDEFMNEVADDLLPPQSLCMQELTIRDPVAIFAVYDDDHLSGTFDHSLILLQPVLCPFELNLPTEFLCGLGHYQAV